MSMRPSTHIKDYINMTLGPLLMMMVLVMFISKYSLSLALLGSMAALSLPAIWKYQARGALYASTALILAFVGIYSFHESSYFIMWILCWCLALVAGLVITALSSQEYYRVKLSLQEIEQERVLQLEQGYQTAQKHLEQEVGQCAEHISSLEQELRQRNNEIQSLKQLIMASKEEADKYFMQSEHLSNEVLKLYKTVGILEETEYLKRQFEEKNKTLLKQLNDARVERYQYQLLAEAASKQPPQQKIVPVQYEQLQHELHELEKERNAIKNSYDQHLRDYQALSDKLQTFFVLDELAYYTHRELSFENSYADLKQLFQEKGKVLQEMRVEIFKIEGAIIQLKKELDMIVEEGFSPGSYLAVADQECLRLEEENAVLLQLLSQTLPLLEKRLEAPQESKAPLEFHNHFE